MKRAVLLTGGMLVIAVGAVFLICQLIRPRVMTIQSVWHLSNHHKAIIIGVVVLPKGDGLTAIDDRQCYTVEDSTGRIAVVAHGAIPKLGATVHVQGETMYWGERQPVMLPGGMMMSGSQQLLYEERRW